MVGVHFALADFVTGGPIVDLPVMKGATWASQINRADALSCTVNLRDAETLALDLRAATEPNKTVLLARNDVGRILAWGIIGPSRKWSENAQQLVISAAGVEESYFGKTLVGPAAARTASLVITEEGVRVPNPLLNFVFADETLDFGILFPSMTLGSIGRSLVAQRLTWPGSPTVFVLPAVVTGDHDRTYEFADMQTVGEALLELTNSEDGPDFAFRAEYSGDGRTLIYRMLHGTEAVPALGQYAGAWAIGGSLSPISNLEIEDDIGDFATASWATGGKSSGTVLASRALKDSLFLADGYPSTDFVDSSRGTVKKQSTMDAYARSGLRYAGKVRRTLTFNVRADAKPGIGEFNVGDTLNLDVPNDHPYLLKSMLIRVTSIKGDEAGLDMAIGADVIG